MMMMVDDVVVMMMIDIPIPIYLPEYGNFLIPLPPPKSATTAVGI